CAAAADGHEALRRTEGERFDLLVLDGTIPGIDGPAVCRAVRSGPTNREIPILMLMAPHKNADHVSLDDGADMYATKPIGARASCSAARRCSRRSGEATPSSVCGASTRSSSASDAALNRCPVIHAFC